MLNIGKKDEGREQQAIDVTKSVFDELAKLGKDKFYEKELKEVDLNSQDKLQQCIVWMMKKYYLEHAHKDEYFLDVGCGGGGFVFKMERLGYISIGLDSSIPKLYLCHTLKNLYKDKRVYFYPGVGEKLPFRNKWFDVTNSTMVLEHIRSPHVLFAEMLRVSKVVTGIIHQDDQEGSPYHTWHMTDKRIITMLMEQFKKGKWINDYEIEYFHDGHSRCCAFVIYANPDFFNTYCEYIDVQKIKPVPSGDPEWEESYYEAILEYGKKIVEDPVFPITVKVVGDGYELDGDGINRMAALRRTNIEKVRVAIRKNPAYNKNGVFIERRKM